MKEKEISPLKEYDLSIVTISYNTIEMTRDCLRSIVENSSGLAIQIIVVDNNSQDGSVDMIKTEFSGVLLIENSENRGFAAANNQGFRLCRSKYILLLNSDTIILGDVLKASVDYMENRQGVGAMGCQVLGVDRTIQPTCSGYPTLIRLLIMTLALDKISAFAFMDGYKMRAWGRNDEREVEIISGCYLLVRKQILERMDYFDERFFFFAEETDLCLRIREKGWRLMFAPVGKIIHYGGGSVKKLNYKRDVMLTAATVKLHYKHGGVFAAIFAYSILMFFNLSRAIFWNVVSLFKWKKLERANHFISILKAYRECWTIK